MKTSTVAPVSLLCLLLLSSFTATSAWSFKGHQIVAEIAQNLLTEKASQIVERWIGNATLAQIAPYPDMYVFGEFKNLSKWSKPLHFINNPDNSTEFIPPLACASGRCAYTAVLNYTDIMLSTPPHYSHWDQQDPNSSPSPLSFLTHFVGDIHQPLHVGFESDYGGNSWKLSWYGSSVNLHKVWDGEIILKYLNGRDYPALVSDLLLILRENPSLMEEYERVNDPADWAEESFSIVQSACYNALPELPLPASGPSPRLGGENVLKTSKVSQSVDGYAILRAADWTALSKNYAAVGKRVLAAWPPPPPAPAGYRLLADHYYKNNLPLVSQQLMRAGVRLAAILNSIQ